jgi:RNA polymerase sigma-70 factor, ECF subfamily
VQEPEIGCIARAQNGDGEAFGKLVEAFQVPVFNLCYRMLGDPEEAEDAAQETFLRAYKATYRYDQQRPFSTWLMSIAAHFCIDQIRRRRMKEIPLEALPALELSDPQPSPESMARIHEEQRLILGLLEKLPPVERAVLILYYWNDFSYEEIGESLDLSLSAVKSRIYRAKRELARLWMEKSNRETIAEREGYETPAF